MLVCKVQGSMCIAAGKLVAVSSHSTLSACPVLPQVVCISPEVISASCVAGGQLLSFSIPTSSPELWLFLTAFPIPLSHLSSLQIPVPHL